jgi:hypothetical protein
MRFMRAPLIGEHNNDIYVDELGMTPGQLEALQNDHII